jgi:malonate decarboxylase alpha subunit
MADWQSEQRARDECIAAGSKVAAGKMVAPKDTTPLLEAVVRPGDRICLEGDNQKQADFLAACLAKADPKVLHDLHVVQSGIVLPEHIDLFEKGIAKKLDFSYSGPKVMQCRASLSRERSNSARSIPTSSCSRATSSTSLLTLP